MLTMRVYSRILQSSKVSPFIIKNCSASSKCQSKPCPEPPPKPKLKKLPVPPMGPTLRKYLRSARPFLSSDEFIKSEEILKEYAQPGGLGEKLHELLEERARSCDNWLEDWWLNTAYLGYRNPVVVHSSPAEIFPWHLFTTEDDYIMAAAKVVMGALDYKEIIESGKLKQEMMGKDPLDMEQYHKVFGTNRTPCLPIDQLKFYPDSRHYIVISNNHFYKVCATKDCKSDITTIYHQLRTILEETKEPGCRVGLLTTDCRDNWAEAYDYLNKDKTSANSIKEIEEALFILCLDRSCPKPIINNMTTTATQVLHGAGPAENSSNRWYDKTLQFVVGRDGGLGIAYEHSPAEGGLIAALMDHINNLLDKKMCYNDPPKDLKKPYKLCFQTDDCINFFINRASKNLTDLMNNLELCCFSFDDFGKEQIKCFKVSPDSFIQLAIQYAFYRIHRVPGAHYESAGLRRFAKGRTEAIRSCSEESIEFSKAMLDETLPCMSKARVLRQAIDYHKQYTIDAMNMLGVDRYLLGIKLIAEENCLPKPPILDDVAYKRSTHFRLSTSQVPSKSDGFMVFGPVTEDGYGCCYNPRERNINFGTSTFRSTGETSAVCFRENLECALHQMKQVLAESPLAKL